MKVKYKEGTDKLSFHLSENLPENEEDILVIDKFENHVWKINKLNSKICYVQISNAAEEFGEMWLNELLGAQLLSEHFQNNPQQASNLILPGQQDFPSTIPGFIL